MVPTFNCASFLRTTLESVLAQDLGEAEMQIEVVDDHSLLDDPEAVVRTLAPGRVGFYRQSHNVGHTRNFNTCLDRSRGHFIHLLHGDDFVLPGFYARMGEVLVNNPEASAAFCRYDVVDERGEWVIRAPAQATPGGVLENWFEEIAVGQRLQPPAMVVRREVYENIGGFDQRIRAYGEDWEMWTRIAAHGPVWYEDSTLACYRVRTNSLSGTTLRTGANMSDLRLVINMNRELMSTAQDQRLTGRAYEANALGALRRSVRLFERGECRAGLAQLKGALGTSRSFLVLWHAALIGPRIAFRIVRRNADRAVDSARRWWTRRESGRRQRTL